MSERLFFNKRQLWDKCPFHSPTFPHIHNTYPTLPQYSQRTTVPARPSTIFTTNTPPFHNIHNTNPSPPSLPQYSQQILPPSPTIKTHTLNDSPLPPFTIHTTYSERQPFPPSVPLVPRVPFIKKIKIVFKTRPHTLSSSKYIRAIYRRQNKHQIFVVPFIKKSKSFSKQVRTHYRLQNTSVQIIVVKINIKFS